MPIVLDNLISEALNYDNRRNHSAWFSYIRNCSARCQGHVVPPTKSEFFKALNAINPTLFRITINGNNFEEQKEELSQIYLPDNLYTIPRHATEEQKEKRMIAMTWIKMIIAFNAYIKLKRMHGYINVLPIDFIGSIHNTHSNRNMYKLQLSNRFIFYLQDSKINDLIELNRMISSSTENNRFDQNVYFWVKCFDIIDNIIHSYSLHRRMRRRGIYIRYSYSYEPPQNGAAIVQEQYTNIPLVDNPNHEIAREYLNREEDEEFIPNNQQIARIIENMNQTLPEEIRRIINEACTLYLSHSVE